MSTIIYAAIFVLISLSFFAFFSWAILYHILRFGFKPSVNKKLAFIFGFVMLALVLFVIVNFFEVNWSGISMNDFLEKSHLTILR